MSMGFRHPLPHDLQHGPSERPVAASRGLSVSLAGQTVRLEERDRRIIARALEFATVLGDEFSHSTHRHRQLIQLMLDGLEED